MKKNTLRIALLLFALFIQYGTFAKTVSETSAKTIGCNYLISMGVSGVKSPADLTPSYTAQSQGGSSMVADFYVFNIASSEGFVMVSADDKVIPVLAYSATSSFDITKIAPAAAAWIDWYKNQIAYVIANDLAPKAGTAEKWSRLSAAEPVKTAAKTTAVAPLLTTLWDQEPYFNAQCPGSGSTKAVTGCVATAMAQVMKFWNWPSAGCGMHSYVDDTYGPLSANFGNTAYQWTSMPNTISGSNAAIATLMYHCGVSVNMHYGTGASGGSGSWPVNYYSNFINCSEYAFKTYFHYKPTIKGMIRFGDYYGSTVLLDSFTTSGWITLLKTELNAGRPFIYTGNDGTSGGHAWVCDGWQAADNFMHFNWGWSGYGPNGYYSVDMVAPPSLGTGGSGGNFNFLQTALIGIQPDTYPAYTGNVKMKSFINFATSMPLKYNAPFSFKTKILNSNTAAFSGDICAQVYDADNNLAGTIQTYTATTIPAGDSTALLTFSTTGMSSLVSKTYNVRMMYRSTGATTWSPVANNGSYINYGMIDVKNDTGLVLYDTLKVTTGLPMHTGSAVTVRTKIANSGMADFGGSVKAKLVNVTTGVEYPITTSSGAFIIASTGNTFDLNISALTAPVGTYALEISHQYNGAGSFYTTGSRNYPNPVLVKVAAATDIAATSVIADEVFVYPNPASDKFNVLFNNHNVSGVMMTDMAGKIVYKAAVDEGVTGMQIPVAGFVPGIYVVQFITDKGAISKQVSIAK